MWDTNNHCAAKSYAWGASCIPVSPTDCQWPLPPIIVITNESNCTFPKCPLGGSTAVGSWCCGAGQELNGLSFFLCKTKIGIVE